MTVAYFDTSAIIKLIRIEPHAAALRAWIGSPEQSDLAWVSSALVLTEVPRVLRRILPGSSLPDRRLADAAKTDGLSVLSPA